MIPEVELEALRCFNRAELEGLQMHSRYLRDLVDRHARTLPLRCLYEVDVQYGQVDIRLTEADREVNETAVWGDQAPEELLRRVKNAFVHRLTVDFREESLPILHHLRANADDLQCQAGALHIEATADAIDYVLVDFMGAHLKPRICETSMDDYGQEEYAMLLARKALRGTVKHVEYQVR
ncbi:hypothetical protein AAVH_25055 [Aphelenchoides avenae]|nr:hypothetical protein AAVH_25055 [Aphelenchus avenae]